MKVTVKDNYLNVRVGKPSVNAPCYQYIAPGSEIEVDEQLYKGDKYGDSDIDSWLKDAAENYYWSGGVELSKRSTTLSTASVINEQWWFDKMRIDDLQKLAFPYINSANKITVAVLDTGLVSDINHSNTFNLTGIYNYVTNTKNIIDASSGHGTLCSSIIAASDKVFGSVNPLANIFIAKIFADNISTNEQIVARAITSLCDPANNYEIDIISLSGGLENADENSPIVNAINYAQQQSVIISAAIGNKLQTKTGFYPALYPYVFSIGALNQKFEFSNLLNPSTRKIDYLLPGENIKSLNFFNCKKEFDGTSHACALMSGILSLIIPKFKAKNMNRSGDSLRSFLNECCDTISIDQNTFFKRINPDLLFNNFKKL